MSSAIRRILPMLVLLTPPAAPSFSQQGRLARIETIGERDINKSNVNLTSIEKEVSIGRQLSSDLDRQLKLLDNAVVNEYANRLGENITRNSDAKIPITFKVIDAAELNAFTLPGGFVYINSGVIAASDNEAEFAAVIAHQIAHVAARHATELEARMELGRSAGIPLVMPGQLQIYSYRQRDEDLGSNSMRRFVQKDVTEADLLGTQYLYKAGYDPNAAVRMLRKVQASEAAKSDSKPSNLRTHPPTADRITSTQKTIDGLLRIQTPSPMTAEFETIKRMLVR